MSPILSREMTVRCEATPLVISSQGIERPRCRACGSLLAIHQPDEKSPEHLLGTCAGCDSWFLIEVSRDGTEAYLLDLPNIALFRAEVSEMRGAKKPRKRKAVVKGPEVKPES